MKKYTPRARTVKKYAAMSLDVWHLCCEVKPINLNYMARKHNVARHAAYALLGIGVIKKRAFAPLVNGKTGFIYQWVNPYEWTHEQIAKKTLNHIHVIRDAGREKSLSSANDVTNQTTFIDLADLRPAQPPKDSYHLDITEPSKPKRVITHSNGNVNVVRLKMFGLTIFEYETRGKN